ncbi:hypothetical protein [Curvivirga sp.]|uniref:hypothetical protein n=1 Tax=Curvivirga sp. TaxID=2856848 RepID=UPI003B5BCFA6
MNELLELPLQLQITLVVGYIGYKVGSIGVSEKHKTLDVLLQVLVFGVIATSLTTNLISKLPLSNQKIIMPFLSLVLVFAIGALWRRFGNLSVAFVLRKFGVTRENLQPSTWEAIINLPKYTWSNVSIRTVDGEYLESFLSTLPSGLPNSQIDVDENGNVAMYLTRRIDADGNETAYEPVEEGSSHITYIPVSRIDRVTVTRFNAASGE